MLHGLYWLAANFALRKPTLLLVDDLHWADEPSLRWLLYLARRLEGLPLLLLAGTRPPESGKRPGSCPELLADPAAAVIRPSTLGQESAAALARERLGDEPDPAFSAALEQGSGGNPLLSGCASRRGHAAGIGADAQNTRRMCSRSGRGAVSYGVSTRLARLPAEATDLLRAAATPRRSNRTTARGRARRTSTWTRRLKRRARLFDPTSFRQENPIEFIHPVVRTAVLEE